MAKKVQYKGSIYVESAAGSSDVLASWLENKGVEIDLKYKDRKWSAFVQGPKMHASAEGKSMNDVLSRACKTFGHLQ